MSDRSFVVICSPSSMPAYVPGAGTSSCNKCGTKVNVAPSTVAMMEADPGADWALHCFDCAMPLITEDAPLQALTEAQRREIAETEQLKELERTATPGPWWYQEESDAYTHIVRQGEFRFVTSFGQDSTGTSEATARLVVALRNNALPIIEAQQAEIERLRSALGRFVQFGAMIGGANELGMYQHPLDEHSVITSFMGCGASDRLTWGDFLNARDALSPNPVIGGGVMRRVGSLLVVALGVTLGLISISIGCYSGFKDWLCGTETFQILSGALDFYMLLFFGGVLIWASITLAQLLREQP